MAGNLVNGLRVVLVGDHPGYLDTITTLLASERGVEIAARGGIDAETLRVIETTAADLVLIDIRMPQMNGVDAVRRIKSLPSSPAVAIVSLNHHDDYRRQALAAGADAFFRKGVFITEVLPWIRKLCQRGHDE